MPGSSDATEETEDVERLRPGCRWPEMPCRSRTVDTVLPRALLVNLDASLICLGESIDLPSS